jgi:hypothetical protein
VSTCRVHVLCVWETTMLHIVLIVHSQSVCHFNSTLLGVHRDIERVTKSAAVGFDDLEEQLEPVLSSIEAGNMPRRWRSTNQPLLPVSLEQGLQGEFAVLIVYVCTNGSCEHRG